MARERPLIIGVVGGSGSGKTTVTRAIYDLPGIDAAFIDQDAYYRDLSHLPLEERKRVNYDHPDAFDTDLLVHQLSQLALGVAVDKPTYDYAEHTRAAATVLAEQSLGAAGAAAVFPSPAWEADAGRDNSAG